MRKTRVALIPLALLAIAVVAIAAGCGSDDDTGAAPDTTTESGSGSGSGSGYYGYGAPPATTAGGGGAAPSGPATVATASGELGEHLVGPNGHTLYLFEKDTGSTSTCSSACARDWPPLLTEGAPMASGGVQAGMLGTTTRDDGTTQVTYGGHPMYSFAEDEAPGDTLGQDVDAFGAEWYVVAPTGEAIEGEG
jgi:predicted lipoprotein with Yx(FWY)xxD motif